MSSIRTGPTMEVGANAPRPGFESAEELGHQPVELRRVLQEHEVPAALALVEDLDAAARDLARDPLLRLRAEQARRAADHEGRDGDLADDVAPVLDAVVHEELRGVLARELEVLGEDPWELVARELLGGERAEEVLGDLGAVGAGERARDVIG